MVNANAGQHTLGYCCTLFFSPRAKDNLQRWKDPTDIHFLELVLHLSYPWHVICMVFFLTLLFNFIMSFKCQFAFMTVFMYGYINLESIIMYLGKYRSVFIRLWLAQQNKKPRTQKLLRRRRPLKSKSLVDCWGLKIHSLSRVSQVFLSAIQQCIWYKL